MSPSGITSEISMTSIVLVFARCVCKSVFFFSLLASVGCQEIDPGVKNRDTAELDPVIAVWEVRGMMKGGSPVPVFAVWSDGFVIRTQGDTRVQGVMRPSDLLQLQATIRSSGFYDFQREHGYVPIDGGMTCIFARDAKGKRAMCFPLRVLPEQGTTPEFMQFRAIWKQVVAAIAAVKLEQTIEKAAARALHYPGLSGEWAGYGTTNTVHRR